MAVQRMEHIGIVVEDLEAATGFFTALGLELQGVRADVVMIQAPGGGTQLELARYHSPPSTADHGNPPANTPGIRHILFVVDDIHAALDDLRPHGAELVGELENYEDSYWLCYVRGPAGIIVELAEKIG
jgi:catechol 2,3-dioxygenase-like lactoylglutathione lyase family enzyme